MEPGLYVIGFIVLLVTLLINTILLIILITYLKSLIIELKIQHETISNIIKMSIKDLRSAVFSVVEKDLRNSNNDEIDK